MNELEQVTPERVEDDTDNSPAQDGNTSATDGGASAEEAITETPTTVSVLAQSADEPVSESEAVSPTTALDITMGDMETDLPTSSDSSAAPAEEMEIPWGEMNLEAEEEEEEEEELAEMETAESSAIEEGTPAVAATAPLKRVWYVVHCYSGYENKVKKGLEQRINSMSLQDRIFRVVVPVEREVEIREGQRKNIERRVFPGYILVEMMELIEGEPTSDEVWYAVRNTPGVTGFVSSGDQQRPVPLRQEEVDKILKRMESEEPKVHVTFRVGQTVHIIDGPFADFRGAVDAVDMTKGKVRVLVSFFGRETPVELDLLQVEKV